MKKYILGLKKLNSIIVIIAILVSILVSYVAFFETTNQRIQALISTYTLEIDVLDEFNPSSVVNREVWINSMMLGGASNMKEISETATMTNFEFRSAQDYGYNNDVIVNVGQESGKISFQWVGGTEDYIEFWMQNLSGIIEINLKQHDNVVDTQTIDLFTTEADQYYRYDIGAFQNTPLIYQVSPYLIVGGIAILIWLVILLLLSKVVVDSEEKNNK